MAIISTIEVEIAINTPFEIKPKTEALKALAKLDLDVLQKLSELSKSPNAISQLKNNFGMIKGFLI
ncbi:hypothetical protein [Flavobacterium sp. I-STPA6A]|uniref:hypothetical protein n=1 Tax=Flavobacterium sp. I-STPA6A TaxID=2590450 RepID=UPI00131C813F|nr:hypothetical protein [Flavobacterium sp. I-STPA6A]